MSRSTLVAALALLAACALPVTASAAPKHHAKPKAKLYVSLGDSYATGYQATGVRQGGPTTNGFANQLPALAKRRGHKLKLVNFGCGGATTTSILHSDGCAESARAIGGPRYDVPQIEAAERFVRRNRKRVALVTVSIGGNDVTRCASGGVDPIPCVAGAVSDLEANVGEVARRLRAAGGRKVRIVGTTYPDVILGAWTSGQPADQDLARLSVVAFQTLINPTLKQAYEAAGGTLVDVTAATGAYGSLDATTTFDPYGVVPVPVAEVCRLTYYCEFRDIHARTDGYRIIAELVSDTLPKRRR